MMSSGARTKGTVQSHSTHAMLCLDGNDAARSHLVATAAIGVLTSSHGSPLQLLSRFDHLNRLARSLPRRIAMALLGDAAHIYVKRSTTSRPCWRPRGRRGHRRPLMQPAIAVAAAASLPTVWLAHYWRSSAARRRVKCRVIDT